MKKIALLMLVLAVAIMLSACGGEKVDGKTVADSINVTDETTADVLSDDIDAVIVNLEENSGKIKEIAEKIKLSDFKTTDKTPDTKAPYIYIKFNSADGATADLCVYDDSMISFKPSDKTDAVYYKSKSSFYDEIKEIIEK